MSDCIRRQLEKREALFLCSHASFADAYLDSRAHSEDPCTVRTAFQRDCHRIAHSKSFRRLKGKTQVFLWPKGDHYRTRLTHCQEVAHLARTVARALALNEDLTEAIALGHDLGHTPFGHAGEDTLQRLVPSGFRHEKQSLRVVEKLERSGQGLNLTAPVRDGIVKHSKGKGPILGVSDKRLPTTLEGQLVRLADLIAYVNHDLDDALRAKVIDEGELPKPLIKTLGDTHSKRLTHLVTDMITHTDLSSELRISMSAEAAGALDELRAFLYARVYDNPLVHAEFAKASGLLERLWDFFISDMDRFYEQFWPGALRDGKPAEDVKDFLAGMTDAFAVELHDQLFSPRRWYVL